jgi:hypothetical protein
MGSGSKSAGSRLARSRLAGSRLASSRLGIRARAARTPERVGADVQGVVQLLVSAKASVKVHGSDRLCGNLIEQSIARLMHRHAVTRPEPSGVPTSDLVDVPSLLRLLIYAKAEVIERLEDATCAEMLDECVGHLLRTHRLSQDQLYQRALSLH